MEHKLDLYDRAEGFKIRPAKVRGFIVESAPRIPGGIPEIVAACSTIEEVVETIRLLFAAEVVVGEVVAPAETATVVIMRRPNAAGETHVFTGADSRERGEKAGEEWIRGGQFREFTTIPGAPIHR